MMERNPIGTVRSALPDTESIVIVGLCSGVVLVFLDALGVDVLTNLQGMALSDFHGVGSMVVFALVSKTVERFREAVHSEQDVQSTRT